MSLLTRTARRAICSSSSSSSRHGIRFFSESSHVSMSTSAEERVISKPTITKKKYSALPKLPRGLASDRACPSDMEDVKYHPEPNDRLPMLDSSTSSLPHVLHADESLSESNENLDSVPLKARKRRTTKRVVLEDSASLESPSADDAANTIPALEDASIVDVKPKRRGRPPKIDVNVIGGNDSQQRPPRNQLAKEILDNIAKFPHCIMLTRVGQFYESYFDQAADVSRLLNIKLTSRMWDGQRILMCGFPLMHLQKYLKIMVQQHTRFVALCEEFPRPSPPGIKPTFERRVVRVVTPGTLIDEPFLNQYENNYLLAIAPAADASGCPMSETSPVSLAWIDVSTGEFFTKVTTCDDGLRDEIVRISPREVVLSEDLEEDPSHPIRAALLEEQCFCSYVSNEDSSLATATSTSSAAMVNYPQEPALPMSSAPETTAVRLLTTFLRANLLDLMPRLSAPSREADMGRMQIDSHTIKALEIREGMREGGVTGSLLSVVKRTVTSGGTRLLARWLCSPSTSISEINARQSLVAFFHARPHLRDDILHSLQSLEDITRVVQKFLLGRGDASDLFSIKTSIAIWSSIQDRISLERRMEDSERGFVVQEEWSSIDALMSRMSDLSWLSRRIETALQVAQDEEADEADSDATLSEPPISSPLLSPLAVESSRSDPSWQNGFEWTINPEFSEELTQLHVKYERLISAREELEERFRRAFDAPSLTLRSSLVLGLHVHISKPKRDAAKIKTSNSFTTISEGVSTSSFFNREWSHLGTQILEISAAISASEKQAFELLRNEVNLYEGLLRRNARIMDEIDVTLGFASLAADMGFVRPTITEDTSFHVMNGRHPTVELGLLTAGRVYTPNTVTFSPESRLHIITGPNMAGKSTLLRQTALVAILAQTGAFVPADHAVVGIVDKLFSRIGAKDDLFHDRSTFMVEMLETAEILKRATPKSLVIMDEVGRGTTVKDGLAIAFAAIHHLYFKNRCRTLFATHFHELTDMLGYSPNHRGRGVFEHVGFFCTDVDETGDGRIVYSHHLRPGVNRDSHGLKVAKLAGIPPPAISVAENALSWLKGNGTSPGLSFDSSDLKLLGQSLGSQDTYTHDI